MRSISSEIDSKINPRFWTSQLNPRECLVLNESFGFYRGELYVKCNSQTYKKRYFIGTEDRLYCVKSSSDLRVLKSTGLNWKTLESFVEMDNGQEVFGFRLKGLHNFFDFYTMDEDSLIYWIDTLSKFTVNKDLSEDFKIKKIIGTGKDATVYKGEEILSKSPYAIKSIPKSTLENSQRLLKSVVTEITLLRTISHPRIIKLYKLYEDNEHIHIVTEYVKGLNLQKKIRLEGKVQEEDAKVFFKSLADVMIYLYSTGVNYKSLESSNILMKYKKDSYDFKLCDFGHCSIMDMSKTSSEVYNHFDDQFDVSSLGELIHNALSGRSEFRKNTDQSRASNGPALPYGAHLAIHALTHQDPQKRPTLQEFLENPWVKVTNDMPQSPYNKTVKYLSSTMSDESFQIYLKCMGLQNEEDSTDIECEDSSAEEVPVMSVTSPGSKLSNLFL